VVFSAQRRHVLPRVLGLGGDGARLRDEVLLRLVLQRAARDADENGEHEGGQQEDHDEQTWTQANAAKSRFVHESAPPKRGEARPQCTKRDRPGRRRIKEFPDENASTA
jgi:hypothetical protein